MNNTKLLTNYNKFTVFEEYCIDQTIVSALSLIKLNQFDKAINVGPATYTDETLSLALTTAKVFVVQPKYYGENNTEQNQEHKINLYQTLKMLGRTELLKNITYYENYLECTDFKNNSISVIVAKNVFCMAANPEKLIQKILDIIKPNGFVLFGDLLKLDNVSACEIFEQICLINNLSFKKLKTYEELSSLTSPTYILYQIIK